MRKLLYVVTAATLAIACTLTASAACRVHVHQRIVLFGSGDDPGVFLWDSRFRLRAYHVSSFDEAQALLSHALLLQPGTRATVDMCVPGFVLPKYGTFPDDAIEVEVTTGSERGHAGWVLGSDTRPSP